MIIFLLIALFSCPGSLQSCSACCTERCWSWQQWWAVCSIPSSFGQSTPTTLSCTCFVVCNSLTSFSQNARWLYLARKCPAVCNTFSSFDQNTSITLYLARKCFTVCNTFSSFGQNTYNAILHVSNWLPAIPSFSLCGQTLSLHFRPCRWTTPLFFLIPTGEHSSLLFRPYRFLQASSPIFFLVPKD